MAGTVPAGTRPWRRHWCVTRPHSPMSIGPGPAKLTPRFSTLAAYLITYLLSQCSGVRAKGFHCHAKSVHLQIHPTTPTLESSFGKRNRYCTVIDQPMNEVGRSMIANPKRTLDATALLTANLLLVFWEQYITYLSQRLMPCYLSTVTPLESAYCTNPHRHSYDRTCYLYK
ncbi:hypothetical protein F4782DRAFT_118095 [Xylaria castorea]|nr:hypothetical protein F4782DRAFT_118095 [Xylaria castorea]